jgi:pyruvate formate lyase activating enzyme
LEGLPAVFLRKTSLVDYPGKVAAVIFLPGCNLRCPWCQNRGLVLGGGETPYPPGVVLKFLAGRKKVLGGVVLSGGEPTMHPRLHSLIKKIHDLGLPVKLDTNGMNPAFLRQLCAVENTRPDYIALDLKLAPARYAELLPRSNTADPAITETDPAAALAESAALINASGIPHEYRSLALPDNYFKVNDIEALAPLVDNSPWYFRPFVPGNCLESAWDNREQASKGAIELLAAAARALGKNGVGGLGSAVVCGL